MSKLTYYYGAMKSGKSADLIKSAMNYWTSGREVLIVKPSIDDRDAKTIKTRLGMTVDCELIPNQYGIISAMIKNKEDTGKKYAAVLVDEVQFFSKDIVVELSSIADSGYPVLCWGLKTDFRTELFEGSRVMLELADKIQEVKTVCQFCERKAILNLRCVKDEDGNLLPASPDDPSIFIGDEEYYQVCRMCYFGISNGDPIPEVKSLI